MSYASVALVKAIIMWLKSGSIGVEVVSSVSSLFVASVSTYKTRPVEFV